MEEPGLLECVNNGTSWESLPVKYQQAMGFNKVVWERRLFKHCLSHQIPWDRSPLRSLFTPVEYYREMLAFLRQNLRMYPYQFADVLINELKVTAFSFYKEMMFEIMRNEKSYDILPNFTAVDAMQLLGIGRNQYIEIMNRVRAKKLMWKINKGIVREFLPTEPLNLQSLEHWWILKPLTASITPNDIKSCSPEEIRLLETLHRERNVIQNYAGQYPYSVVQSLFRRELIHFEVPVLEDDLIMIPPISNFIMNRTSDDSLEKLLYDVLVTVDERTTMKQLAHILQVPMDQIKLAVSIYLRLGLARKKTMDPLPSSLPFPDGCKWHTSWLEASPLSASYAPSASSSTISPLLSIPSEFAPPPSSSSSSSTPIPVPVLPSSSSAEDSFSSSVAEGQRRIGFFFDSSLTAYLMMGNLAEGLKDHAVTLFEAGKMPDEMMDSFLEQLDKIKLSSQAASEGDARRYYEHAITLRNLLRFLRKNSSLCAPNWDGGVDMIRSESISSLQDSETKVRILDKNYGVLIAMAPLTPGVLSLPPNIPRFFGPPIPQISSPWFRLYMYSQAKSGPLTALFVKGTRLRSLPPLFLHSISLSSDAKKKTSKKSLCKPKTAIDIPPIDDSIIVEGCDKVTLASWDGEPSVLGVTTALQILNDALMYSATMLQSHSFYDLNMETMDVPFPLDLTTVGGSKEEEEEAASLEPASWRSEPVRALLSCLQTHLHLSKSLGVVRLQKLTSRVPSSDAGEKWVPVDIFFGMPLYSSDLNAALCRRVAVGGLMSADGLAAHHQEMQLLCRDFLDFIDTMIDQPVRRESSSMQACLPTSTIYFDGKKLHKKTSPFVATIVAASIKSPSSASSSSSAVSSPFPLTPSQEAVPLISVPAIGGGAKPASASSASVPVSTPSSLPLPTKPATNVPFVFEDDDEDINFLLQASSKSAPSSSSAVAHASSSSPVQQQQQQQQNSEPAPVAVKADDLLSFLDE